MAKKPSAWYKEITIRPVIDVDGYELFEKVCSYVADIFFSTKEQELHQKMLDRSKESIYISAYTLYKVGQSKCPAYWVGKDLLRALMQSELDIQIDSLHWAMKTGIFMLPQNTILAPSQESISAIFWYYNDKDRILYWTAFERKNCFCRKFEVNENTVKSKYVDIRDIEDYQPHTISDFNNYLQSIFLRLILIMECRPELLEEDTQVVRVNKGFGKAQAQNLYQPIWLGKSYAIKSERDGEGKGGTHASPKVHWRRGYLRNQPYGEGRKQRKLVWIEPVLVMGGDLG